MLDASSAGGGPTSELPRPLTPAVRWVSRSIPARIARAGAAAGAGTGLLAITGLIVLVSAPFLGLGEQGWRPLLALSVVMAVFVAVSMLCPWAVWPAWSTLAFPLTGLLVLALLGLSTDSVAAAYLGVIPLWFVYTGLFHRLVAGSLLVPFASGAYVAMSGAVTSTGVVRLAVYAAVWFAISAILAVMSSQQRLVTAHLEMTNLTDPLTGLGNRRSLELRLAKLADGDCVVLCDLDLFKSINDAFGHAAGDVVLAQFGALLDLRLRRRDYAARFGGEEFVLILMRTDPAQALAALAAVRTEWLDLEAGVTFSAGLAVSEAGVPASEVLAAADAALYAAKAGGRDRFEVAQARADVIVPPVSAA